MVTKFCAMEDAWRAQKEQTDSICAKESKRARLKRLHHSWPISNVPSGKKKKSATGSKTALDGLLDRHAVHSVVLNDNPTHSLRACWVVKQVTKSGEAVLSGVRTNKHAAVTLDEDDEILIIYETYSSRNKRKRALRELGQFHHVASTDAWTSTRSPSKKRSNQGPAPSELLPPSSSTP
jgi:hypothetical protein